MAISSRDTVVDFQKFKDVMHQKQYILNGFNFVLNLVMLQKILKLAQAKKIAIKSSDAKG